MKDHEHRTDGQNSSRLPEATIPAIDHEKWMISWTILGFSMIFLFPAIWQFGSDMVPYLDTINRPPDVRWRENFTTYFVSITLEATPYMILGAFIAAMIEVFVPQTLLPRMAQRLGFWGIPVVILSAPLFPSCECGVVLVVRRLLAKGLPLPHAVAWMLAAPIFNPVVLVGTWLAFYQDSLYPLLRGLGGILVAMVIGFLLLGVSRKQAIIPALERTLPRLGGEAAIPVVQPVCVPGDGCGHHHGVGGAWGGRLRHALLHVRHDFLEMGTYFLFGVFLASLMKTFIAPESLFQVGNGDVSGPAAMMGLSFVLSLCSEADAFVAASFAEFDRYAHVAFLVLGPMLDIKLLLMYRTLFQTRFIVRLAILIPLCVSCYILLLHMIPQGWYDGWYDLWYDLVYGMGGMM